MRYAVRFGGQYDAVFEIAVEAEDPGSARLVGLVRLARAHGEHPEQAEAWTWLGAEPIPVSSHSDSADRPRRHRDTRIHGNQ